MNVGKIGKRTSLLQVSPGGSSSGQRVSASDEHFVGGFFYARAGASDVPEVYPGHSIQAHGPPPSILFFDVPGLPGRGPL